MPRFVKKPIVVEAVQFTGDNTDEILEFGNGRVKKHDGRLIIETLEGKMTISPLDWVIKGGHGEFYPCKPDIFEQTYDHIV